MSAWLKAGLIGTGVLIVLSLIGLVPLLGCITLPLTLLTYVIIGVMAAAFMPAPRTAGGGAGQGALAALLAGIISGIISMLLSAAQMAIFGGARQALSQIPPELLDQLRDVGVDPKIFVGTAGLLIGGTLCCLVGTMVAVTLGAIGGAIYAAIKPE